MLECKLAQQEEMKVKYLSELGLLSVHYKCGYYNLQQKLYVIKSSMGADTSFAMVREPINDHTVRYGCKSPFKDSFDAMVFTIEWTEEENC